MNKLKVRIKPLVDPSKLKFEPVYGSDGAAAFDLYACSVKQIADNVFEYGTGFAIELPEGYGMLILSRSGHGFKYQTRLSNCVGLLDEDYRGEVKVQLISDVVFSDEEPDQNNLLDVKVGDRIAQAIIVPIPKVEFSVVDELSETVRGTGGFGSTGVN